MEVSEAHFMHAVEHFAYFDKVLPDYQVVKLPFAYSQMSMIFVLPMMMLLVVTIMMMSMVLMKVQNP